MHLPHARLPLRVLQALQIEALPHPARDQALRTQVVEEGTELVAQPQRILLGSHVQLSDIGTPGLAVPITKGRLMRGVVIPTR